VRVDDEGPLRLTELAENLGVDVSTVSRQVAALERSGLVARTRDASDGRATQLATTTEGRRVVRRLRQARREALSDIFGSWDPDDLATFALLLDRFVEDITQLTEPE
jgi:DNA-binding MarR family transcriptional regulator